MDDYPLEPLWSYFRDGQLYFSRGVRDIWEYCLLPYLMGEIRFFEYLTWTQPKLVATIQLPESLEGQGVVNIFMFLQNGDLLLTMGGWKVLVRFRLKTNEVLWTLPLIEISSLDHNRQLDYVIWSTNEKTYWLMSCVSEQITSPAPTPISEAEFHRLQASSTEDARSGLSMRLLIKSFDHLPLTTPDGSRFRQMSSQFNRGYLFQTITSSDHHWIRIYRAIQ